MADETKRRSDVRYLRDDSTGETFIVCKHCGSGFRHKCGPQPAAAPAARKPQ